MDLQILKDNRTEIIEKINDLRGSLELIKVMKRVSENAQLGCYFDLDDIDEVIKESIHEIISEEGTKAQHYLEDVYKKSSRELMKHI